MADAAPSQESCFVPDPAYTFLFADPLPDLCCVICKEAKLTVAEHGHTFPGDNGDSNAYLVACGHIFCRKCCNAWFATKTTCPVCRFDLRHKRCRHLIKSLKLSPWNILFGPQPLPAGGKVPDQCSYCRDVEERTAVVTLCKPVAKCYYGLKLEAERWGSEEDTRAMELAKRNLDRVTEAVLGLITCYSSTDEW
ncbi:hypothetical protein C8A01DRAFT_32547 [Parachaetomium inaequale]|uniref:RING-type domain-containing protein n=1 Tax=Parachaetomium inaequale TaxID=2588326 RepID=A0AAN6PM11_9PEZI|nr:hypothetical protein C8A01DRAFT_32547 [Parachaetomium inaequale]